MTNEMRGPKEFDLQQDKDKSLDLDGLKNDLKDVQDPATKKVLKRLVKFLRGKDA